MVSKQFQDKFLAIKANADERLESIKSRYNNLSSPSTELGDKLTQMEEMVLGLEIISTLEYHLELKLLIQEIEAMLEEEESTAPLREPSIGSLSLFLENGILKVEPIDVSDIDNVISNFKYKLSSTGIEREVIESPTPERVTFETNSSGVYSTMLEYFFDLKDERGTQSKKVLSNSVTIEEEIEDDELPRELPYSNSWAYAHRNGSTIDITLNNTWGVIGSKLGVYVNGVLKGTQIVNHTAANRGSAKNSVDITSLNTASDDDVKVVYKVTFKREDREDVVMYYKSTTGRVDIADPSGRDMCQYTKWDSSLTGPHTDLPVVWHNGSHWKASYWINSGDVPGEGANGWKEYDYPQCPDVTDPDLHPKFAPSGSHLAPMDPNKVEGLGTPMEKKHITYIPEWAKWGGRKYTPKIAPWDKVSHIQYAFIDVRPDYTNGFDLDKDFNIIPLLRQSVQECPNYSGTPLISPNVFEPAAAFSEWGGTNAFHPEFVEYSRKYPYVAPLMSLGGWSRSGYFRDAASDENRGFFVDRCIELMRVLNIKGVDIDWEFPGYEREGDLADNPNDMGTPRGALDEGDLFTLLMRDLRVALDRAGEEDGRYYQLACAINAGRLHMENSEALRWHKYCDFISYMTYDTHGAFDPYTNHQSYTHQNSQEDQGSTNPLDHALSIENLINFVTETFEIPRYKLIVGTPFYSRGWSGVKKDIQTNGQWPIPSLPGLFARVEKFHVEPGDLQGRAAPGVMDGGRGAGVMPFRHLNALKEGGTVSVSTLDPNGPANPFHGTVLKGQDFNYYYDSEAQVPYLFNEKDGIFYTYEDEVSLDYKAKYVINQGLGGLISWDISLDDYGSFAHGIDGETYDYNSMEVEDHQLTDVIFENFKTQ